MPVIPREQWDSEEEYIEYLRHLFAYETLAHPYVHNKYVLDIGCGAGYGVDNLSAVAASVVGMDISMQGVSHYWARYEKSNSGFVLGNATRLAFKAGSFDVVVSFQVIEHIEPKFVLDYLREIRRVLRTGGTFICSTPNKKLRLLPFQKPWNPEHRKEYDYKELSNLLSKVFEEVKVYGLCGSEGIFSIERNRVKQTPLKVYIAGPIVRLIQQLPSPILAEFRRMRQRFLQRQVSHKRLPQETFRSNFSLNNFKIDRTCPKDCLDLYGICTKVKD